MSGLFTAFRENGAPTFYEAMHTPVEADILVSGLIFAFVIIAFSFYLVLPGIRGKEGLFTFIRITVSLFIGAVILISNFEMTWEVSETSTHTKYKAGTGEEISADIGVYIGLRGINITLKGTPEVQNIGNVNETINYNEHFSWEWSQGRLGFGPFAGRFQQEYRAAQFRGLPLPILWIAEYFTFDGEGIRWGRHYRQAGWYAHIVLWLAFPLWLLSNILFFVLLRDGAILLGMTGLCMVVASIIWATLRNVNELIIPFTDTERLEFSFGGSYYICLITGIACIIMAAVIIVMDLRLPREIANFFNVDVIQDSEEVQVEQEETPTIAKDDDEDDELEHQENGNASKPARNGGPASSSSHADDQEPTDDDIYEVQLEMPPPPPETRPHRRFTKHFQKLQAPRRRPPPPPPPPPAEDEDPDEDYQNMPEDMYVNREAIRMDNM